MSHLDAALSAIPEKVGPWIRTDTLHVVNRCVTAGSEFCEDNRNGVSIIVRELKKSDMDARRVLRRKRSRSA